MSRHATSLKRCPPAGCDSACNSGRMCLDSLNATRRVLWMPPVDDKPIPRPSIAQVTAWTLFGLVIGCVMVALFKG